MKITISVKWQLFWTLLFVILRVAGVTSWSWVWVFSPLWIPFLFVLTLFALILVAAILVD